MNASRGVLTVNKLQDMCQWRNGGIASEARGVEPGSREVGKKLPKSSSP